jgi:putative two-component system response regulator
MMTNIGELRERLAYLELLNALHTEILKVIRIYTSSEHFTTERSLQEIVTFIQKKFDVYIVSLLLLDDISRELVLYCFAGRDTLDPSTKNLRIQLDEGLTGECAKAGESVVVNDVTGDPRFIRGPFPKTSSELCVPIRIRGRVVGVLDLQHDERGRFAPEVVQVMEQVTMNVGFMLENKKLYDDLKSHNETLEKRVEEKVHELKRSEERYRAIVEHAADPILISDLTGRIAWGNRAAMGLLGYELPEVAALNLTTMVKKGYMHPVYNAIREARDGKEVRSIQVELVTKRGEERTVEFSCIPIRENGSTTGLEITTRDITDKIVIEKLKKNYMKSLEEAVVDRTAEIKDTQRAAILAIANLAESIDDDTGGHIQRIQLYSKVLGNELKRQPKYKDQITEDYVEMLHDLSPLHDLGKVGIRDYILQKTDKLTHEEFEKMKEHTLIGARALRMAGEMIRRESIFAIGEMIAKYHHEKWDGSGYPAVEVNGEQRPLKGEEIPLCARIVALADVYDALTSKRPYKMPFPHEKARDMIIAQAGKHFDPDCVQAFLRCEREFMEVREMYPDNIALPEGKPFELPARDRA